MKKTSSTSEKASQEKAPKKQTRKSELSPFMKELEKVTDSISTEEIHKITSLLHQAIKPILDNYRNKYEIVLGVDLKVRKLK